MKKYLSLARYSMILVSASIFFNGFELNKFHNYNGSGGNGTWSKAASISFDNCLVIGGDYSGTVQFYPGINSSSHPVQSGGFLIKYSQSNIPIWVKSLPGARINDIIQDDACNIYVAGSFSFNVYLDPDSLAAPTFTRSPNRANSEGFIAKYTSSGKLLGAKKIAGYECEATNLSISQSNLYVGGYFFQTVELQSGKFNSQGDRDIFLCSYDLSLGMGIKNTWELQFSGPSRDEIYDLHFKDGKLLVAGNFSASLKLEGSYLSGSTETGFLAIVETSGKIANAFGLGTKSSTRMYSGCFDQNGRIICTGSFAGTTDFDPSPTRSVAFTSSKNRLGSPGVDMFIGIYDLSAVPSLVNVYPSNGVAQGISIRADYKNNMIIGGNFDNTITTTINGKKTTVSSTSQNMDAFLLQLDPSGNPLDLLSAGGIGDDRVSAFAVSTRLPRYAIGMMALNSTSLTCFDKRIINTTNSLYISIYNE